MVLIRELRVLLPSQIYSRHLRATWISLTSSTSKCPRRIASLSSRREWAPARVTFEYAK